MKTYRIAIDANEANVANRVGSNVYAFEILNSLEQMTRSSSQIEFTVLLSSPASKDLPKTRNGWQYKIIKPRPFWTQWALPIHLFLNKYSYDVLFTPGHYAPRLSSVPYVSSVMDLAFLHFPDQFKKSDLLQLTDWTKYSVKKARKVIAISEFTKQDVLTHYHREPTDVVVAYPAVQSKVAYVLPARAKSIIRKFNVQNPSILYVGTLQPRKNLIALLEAFEMVCRSSQTKYLRRRLSAAGLKEFKPQLIIAGKIGWLADDIVARIKSSPFFDQIVLTGYIDEPTKQVLYQKANCSVLVGLYEGFGIPPLESLKFGTIPVVSNTTSLPEVVGKAGILVDPQNIPDIAQGLLKALTLTPREKAQYSKAGQQQLHKFSWYRSAETILKTLIDVADQT